MENEERIGVILDIKGDVDKIKSSIGSLQKDLSGVQLPKGLGKEFETRMRKLSDEIENFEKMASKAGNSFEGAKQIDASYKKILDYARKIEISFSAIKKEANLDTSKFFPKEIIQRIEKAEEAFQRYEKAIEKGDEALQKQKKSLKDIEAALIRNENKRAELTSKRDAKKASYDKISSEQGKIKTTKSNELAQEQKNLEILKQKKIALDAEKAAVEALTKKKEALEKSEKAYASRKEQYGAKDSKAKAEKQVLNINKKAYEEAEQAVKKYGDTIRSVEDIELDQSKTTSSIEATKTAIKGLGKEIDAADDKIKKAQNAFDTAAQDLKENETAANSLNTQMKTLKTTIEQTENAAKAKGLKELVKSLDEIGIKIDPATSSLEDIQKTINNLKPDAIKAIADALDKAGVNLDELDVDLANLGKKNTVFQEGAKGVKEMSNQLDQLKGHIQQFFSLTNSVMLFRRGIQQAIETIKELDKAMTETAVVTDFSVGDMWNELPRYTKAANELGATTLGAYETMTLFYQQGLKTNEAFEIGTETMKMARIAGLDYADATNLMTAALRGFNMELNNVSASRINDVYSELAAITAADTNEIASAMTKTASIANSANMEFETTAALLSQIIETTREPAETAGTALKTIIARFTEMKKATSDIISVEGEEVSVNKVEDALRSAGVALRDVNGEFRDLDDVFLELSSKWNGLDMMTQRYIATMAAGSRQQSRFIAMMQDYERTVELVDAAYSSSGASQRQFEKTQESLESKLNKLKNAWDEFLMGISNSTVIKKGVDALTSLLNVINKLTGNSGIGKLLVAIGALKGGSAIFNSLFNATNIGKAIGKKFDLNLDASKLIDLSKMGKATDALKSFSKKIGEMSGQDILGVLKNGLSNVGTAAFETGKSFLNLGKAGLGAGKSLITGVGKALLAIPGWGWAAAAAVAAVGAALYALWYDSGLQTAKRQAEADAATLKDTQEYVSGLTEKVRELDDAWESLTEGQNNLDGLVEGTVEWTEQVQKLNEEVQALLQKYPELYKYLNINQSTGQWSLDETGYKTYETHQKQEQKESKNRELYETAMSNYSTGFYELIEKSAQDDNLWNYLYGYGDEAYSDEIKKFYLKQNDPAYDRQGSYQKQQAVEAAPSAEDILKDTEIRRQIADSNSKEAKASLKYYDEKSKLDKQLKSEESAYIKNYLATSGKYGKKTQDAVTQTMNKLPSSFETLQKQRGKYAGDTRGKGATMQGEAEEGKEKTVEQIMKARGYELIDADKNWYKNNVTGKYVNVDSVGGGVAGEEIKEKTVNGEKVKMETWSNEYVKDLGRQDVLRTQQEKNMEILGNAFAKDINLAKMAAGDLSANLGQIKNESKNDIVSGDDTLFNYQESYDAFVDARASTMEELNKQYNNAFKTNKTGEYTQKTYEAAQATIEFEESVKSLGTNTKNNLTATFLALKDLEKGFDLNVIDNSSEETKAMVNALNSAGVSANKLQDYVQKIDMSSAINGARQLKQDLEEGGEAAALAATVLSADSAGNNFYSVGNQFKELIAGEQWMEKTQAGLSEIYKLEGQITADNIRELAEENSDLAAVLDTNSLKASGFAKMMEAVESGTIGLTDVTSDLIKVYDGLYYSADLAGEAIARLESANIKESDTKVGNIYSESYGAVKDLIKRGAYGDTQIDDYMNQMLGGSAWTDALANAKGNKQEAIAAINKQYGLSSNKGNLYGSWKKQISNAGGSIADGAIKMGANGQISYDLSNIQSTQQLVQKIMEDTGVTKEYAEAMLGDMKTYSTTLGSDLDALDKRGTLNEFVNSRTTKDGVLNISEAEKAAFAQARGQTVEDFEKDLLANEHIDTLEDRKYSESGHYYTTEDKEGNKTVKFTDAEVEDGAKDKLIKEIQDAANTGLTDGIEDTLKGITDLEDLQTKLQVELESADGGGPLTEEVINSLIGVDSVREIMLDPNLDEAEKTDLLEQILTPTYAGAANGLAQGLLGEESIANAQAMADYMGVETYNKMGAQLTAAMDLLGTHKVEIPFSFSGLTVTLPSNMLTDVLGIAGQTLTLLGGGIGSKIVIGGSGTGLSTPFVGKTSTYTPKTVDVGGITGGQTGGNGNAYTNGNDNANDPTQSGSNGNNSGKDETNDTNPKLENIARKLANLEREFENGTMSLSEYITKKTDLLTQQQAEQQNDIQQEYNSSKYKDYFYYDKESDSYLLDEEKFSKVTDASVKNAIMKAFESIDDKQVALNQTEDALKALSGGKYFGTHTEEAEYKRLEDQFENGEITFAEFDAGVTAFLEEQIKKYDAQFDDIYNNSQYKDYYEYDSKTGQLLLKDLTGVGDELREAIIDQYETLTGLQDSSRDLTRALKGIVGIYNSVNEDNTIRMLNWEHEQGKSSAKEYSDAVQAQKDITSDQAYLSYLTKVAERAGDFESGLFNYSDPENKTGFITLNHEEFNKLTDETARTEALKFLDEANEQWFTYVENQDTRKPGNQYNTSNEESKLEAMQRLYDRDKLSATAHAKGRETQLKAQEQKLTADILNRINTSSNSDLYKFDPITNQILLNMEEFNNLTEEAQAEVLEELEILKGINGELASIKQQMEDKNNAKYSTFAEDETQKVLDANYQSGLSSAGEHYDKTISNLSNKTDILTKKQDTYYTDEYMLSGLMYQDVEDHNLFKVLEYEDAMAQGYTPFQYWEALYRSLAYNNNHDPEKMLQLYEEAGIIKKNEDGTYALAEGASKYGALNAAYAQQILDGDFNVEDIAELGVNDSFLTNLSNEEIDALGSSVKRNISDYDIDFLSGDLLFDPVTGVTSINPDRKDDWSKQELDANKLKASGVNDEKIEIQETEDYIATLKTPNAYTNSQLDKELEQLQHDFDAGIIGATEYWTRFNSIQKDREKNARIARGRAFTNAFYSEDWDTTINPDTGKVELVANKDLNYGQQKEMEYWQSVIDEYGKIDYLMYNPGTKMFQIKPEALEGKTDDEITIMNQGLAQANAAIGVNPNNAYINYDEETGDVVFSGSFYGLSEQAQQDIIDSYASGYESQDTIEDIRDTLKDPDFRDPKNRISQQRGEAEAYNAQKDLSSLSYRENELAGYGQLISQLPQELQGPLTLATSGVSMVYQAEKSQILRAQQSGLEQQLQAYEKESRWLGEGKAFEKDSITGLYKLNADVWANMSAVEKREAEAELEMADKFEGQIQDIKNQRNGGIFQKPFYFIEEAAEEMQKTFKETEKDINLDGVADASDKVEAAFDALEKKLGLSENALDKFKQKALEFVNKGKVEGETEKQFTSKGVLTSQQLKDFRESVWGSYIGDDTFNLITSLWGKDENNQAIQTSYSDLFNSIIGSVGEAAGFTGDLLNFETMGTGLSMINTAKGIFDQIKQKITEIVGYIAQATQVVIDAWVNREDYLYNFLQVIEKHLQEYEKLQRYQTQIENGRLTTSQEILNNWNEQWASLQQQLEEQTERVEARQKELDRSRFNPFMLLSGWDPTSDTLYENREPKFIFDLVIGAGEAVNFMGTGAFFSQINQLYEDYDSRVQKSYEDRLAAEQALLDIEDQRVELVKIGSDEATRFEQKLLDAMIQKEQEAIDELSRLNDAVTDANSKLISTFKDNLDKIRQDRENEKKEEELGEKERRLAYLRQDTSGANLQEIKKLEKELDEGHEDYTDNLIDQKISELEKQNELAAEQREKQIELLQGQLDYAEKYGLYWDKIYGMLYTIDENGQAVLNSENFDVDGNIRENSELAQLLGTFSDRMGMSTWSSVLDNEEAKRLGRYYGAFIGMNGVDGNWANYWALLNPGGKDPRYGTPEQEIPDGIWGVLYRLESGIKTYFSNSDLGLVNMFGRADQGVKNFFGKLFGNDELANYKYDGPNNNSTLFSGIKGSLDDAAAWATRNISNPLKDLIKTFEPQNNGDDNRNINIIVEIDKFGESIGLDELTDSVVSTVKSLFYPNGVAQAKKGR